MPRLSSPGELIELRRKLSASREAKRLCVSVCSRGASCSAAKGAELADALTNEIARQQMGNEVELHRGGCFGLCQRGPIVLIRPGNVCYVGVKPEDAAEIVGETLRQGRLVERRFFEDALGQRRTLGEIPFYKHQERLLLDGNTLVDPQKIDDYIAIGGYQALVKALLEMEPPAVIEMIKRSGLRGRGGGGFPAGVKWETTRNAPGDKKYVIVNGDEGDPGAYMDRSLMEGNPHSILEGLIIGAYAIGAHEGFFYVRQEYPVATENILIALEQARHYGLLGKDILGSGFDFNVTLHRGAGAFVSGESSALMTAIEGKVGQPRLKYVHTSVSGIWDRPSNLNNVETWANVPFIVNNGVDWFRSMGTDGSKGTKIFSLVGKVLNTGLVEVPMGITLRDIVYKIGGGIRDGKKFKAIQTGGPSGGFLPESLLDLKVDFDELTRAGSMMGSGGMIVMDENDCMVDAARYYVDFLAHESCGQCIPCREGLRQMLKVLKNMVAGEGREGDIGLLEELSELMESASMCALGQTAHNPVVSALKYFRSEFDAHIHEKRCPALVCRDLIYYEIDLQKCPGCGLCRKECPTEAILGKQKGPHVIDQDKCIKCGNCLTVCPKKVNAVLKLPGKPKLRPAEQGATAVL